MIKSTQKCIWLSFLLTALTKCSKNVSINGQYCSSVPGIKYYIIALQMVCQVFKAICSQLTIFTDKKNGISI